MSKKIFVKTLLTTSTVGLLGGGIAASLVGCSPKGTRALIIESTSPITREVGDDFTIKCSYREIGFKDRNLKIIGEDFEPLEIIDDETFRVTLPAGTPANTYNLCVYDSISGVESNSIPVTLLEKNSSTKVLTITPDATELVVGDSYEISGTFAAANFDIDQLTLAGDDASHFRLFDVDLDNRSFTVELQQDEDVGTYALQFQDTTAEVTSNVYNIKLESPVENSIAVSLERPYVTYSESATYTLNGRIDFFNVKRSSYARISLETYNPLVVNPTIEFLDDENVEISFSLSEKIIDTIEFWIQGEIRSVAGYVYSNLIYVIIAEEPENVGLQMNIEETNVYQEQKFNGSIVIDPALIPTVIDVGFYGADASNFVLEELNPNTRTFIVHTAHDTLPGKYQLQIYMTFASPEIIYSNIVTITVVDYYNMDGTNWPGYESGKLALELDTDKKTAMIVKDSEQMGNYIASDWEIPPYVSDGISVYTVIGIDDIATDTDCFLTVESVTFPLTFKKIGDYAFYEAGLTTMPKIPEGVETIGAWAFAYNLEITGLLTIPMSVTTVGESAFETSVDATSRVSAIAISNPVTTFGANAFENQGDGSGTQMTLNLTNYTSYPEWTGRDRVSLNSSITNLTVNLYNSSRLDKDVLATSLGYFFTNYSLAINVNTII